MEPRTLAGFVDEWKANGGKLVTSLTSPALVVREVGVSSDSDEESGFDTQFMSRAAFAAAEAEALGREVDPESSVVVGRVFFLRKRPGGAFPDRIGVGRAPNVDVRISLAQLSKYHAYFSVQDDGVWCLTDAGSKNGTVVRGQRLLERTPIELGDGDELAFGPHRFTFHLPRSFVELLRRRAAR